jgi:hypothetical protein
MRKVLIMQARAAAAYTHAGSRRLSSARTQYHLCVKNLRNTKKNGGDAECLTIL